MAQVYNPQWGRSMAVDTPLMRRMRAENFAPQHTGGGCFAWERPTDDGGYIWITDGDGCGLGRWSERLVRTWLVGRYTAGGDDWLATDCLTLNDALRTADTMPVPCVLGQAGP